MTIKDLAGELGLSITTISRALNGYSDVGEATRKRVEEAAKKRGYRPNRNAQRLVMQRTRNLAWVHEDNDRRFVDPHFAEVMAGVLRGARAGNYDIVLSADTSERQIAAYDRYVKENSVDGFIVDLPRAHDPRISFLLEARKPFVVHGRGRRHQLYSWVDIDNFGNYYNLARLMIANGHRHMAFINANEQFMFAEARRRGVMAALEDMGLPQDSVRTFSMVPPLSDAGYEFTEIALEDKRVTAILYPSAMMAVEGHAALTRAGREVGRDVAVGTMDDQVYHLKLSSFSGVFTFVHSSLRNAGYELAAELIRLCEQDGAPRGTLVPSYFDVAAGMDATILETPRRKDELLEA